MQVANNTLKAFRQYFQQELSHKWPENETNAIEKFLFAGLFNAPLPLLLTEKTKRFSESEIVRFVNAVKKLKDDMPLAYVLGNTEFFGLSITVNKHVLIPRPETEELCAWILAEFPKEKTLNVLDIGTGSGCIALALQHQCPNWFVHGIDVSEEAVRLAQKNANKLNNKATFSCADMAQFVPEKPLDIIVSNPPYITLQENCEMDTHVLKYEPHLALFVENNDALHYYRILANVALNYLKPGGSLFLECNPVNIHETANMVKEKGLKNTCIKKDIFGKVRMLKAEKV